MKTETKTVGGQIVAVAVVDKVVEYWIRFEFEESLED